MLTLLSVLSNDKDGRSIKSSVQLPMSGFNITEDDVQYNLVGTIHHTPHGPEHGHYTSICQSQHSRNWFNYNDDSVSISKFTNMKQRDRVLKAHTKTANILFYVSGELQTHNGSQVPIDLQYDTTDDTGEGGGEMTYLKASSIIKEGEGKTTLNQPHHLKVSVKIAFHKKNYNESKAITAQYVRSNIS